MLIKWLGNEPFEVTPRFYEARPCPQCGRSDTANPKRLAPPGNAEAIRARCFVCRREGELRPTWREALRAFYGELMGRSPRYGPQVGSRFRVKLCDPPVYPFWKLSAGDVVTLIDFETGAFTVQRDGDGMEEEIAFQNIGEIVA
jgi:hypothetical protein